MIYSENLRMGYNDRSRRRRTLRSSCGLSFERCNQIDLIDRSINETFERKWKYQPHARALRRVQGVYLLLIIGLQWRYFSVIAFQSVIHPFYSSRPVLGIRSSSILHRSIFKVNALPVSTPIVHDKESKEVNNDESTKRNNRNGNKKSYKNNNNINNTRNRVSMIGRNVRNIEQEMLHLSRSGRIQECLALYRDVWAADEEEQGSKIVKDEINDKNKANASKLGSYGTIAKPNTRLMNRAIDACARASPPLVDEAWTILHHGEEGGKLGTRRLCPNIYTFGSLTSVCAKVGDVNKSLEIIKRMKNDYKILPNAVVYATAISACEKSMPPKPQLALNLLHEATNPSNIDGSLTVVAYNAAISVLSRAEKWKDAINLLQLMEQRCGLFDTNEEVTNHQINIKSIDGASNLLHPDCTVTPAPDVVTYGTVMAACERSGQWTRVLEIADKLDKLCEQDNAAKGLGQCVEMDSMAITSALHACQQLGMADKALEYLERMKQLKRQHHTNSHDNRKKKDKGHHDSSLNLSPNGRRPSLIGPDSVAYRLAISACSRARTNYDVEGNIPSRAYWEDGIRLLDEMEEVTAKPPDVVAYTAAIGGCVDVGEYLTAFELLERMEKRHNVTPNVVTYTAVLGACASACAKASWRYRENSGDNNRISDGTNTVNISYTQVSSVKDEVKMPKLAALALLERMKKKGGKATPNIVAYNAAMRACAEGHDLISAFRLLSELQDEGLKPTVVTFGTLMTACERVGSVEAAGKVFQLMKESGGASNADNSNEIQNAEYKPITPNEIIYGAAISTCRKAAQPDRAVLLLRKMIKSGLAPNTATFNTVLMAQTEFTSKLSKKDIHERLDVAIAVYKLLNSDHSHKDTKPNRQTYNIIVQALASNGRPLDAEYFLNKMRSNGYTPDVDLFTSTVTAYERNKEPMKALSLMESMRRDGYDFYDIKVVNEAFKKAIRLADVVQRGLKKTTGDNDAYLSSTFPSSSSPYVNATDAFYLHLEKDVDRF